MVFVVGATVVALGAAMIVLPGPAMIVIPLGLAILGIEFAWARRWLKQLRGAAESVVNGWNGRPAPAEDQATVSAPKRHGQDRSTPGA